MPAATTTPAPGLALPPKSVIADDVARALAEDIGSGDVTAGLLPASARAQAHIVCREPAVIAGTAWAAACFHQLDPATQVDWQVRDGQHVAADTTICRLLGKARVLVSAERTAINFLQTLSATATVAHAYASAVAGTRTRVLDTRKTLPGLRAAQKYAVHCGGACNHRAGLFDAFLIKENHIAAAGSITAAVHAARAQHPQLLLEVEVETSDELDEAIACGADRIMLDEFSRDALRLAVARTDGRVPLEVSGGVDLQHVAEIAATGVDFISVGALTKHIRAIDLSMRLTLSQCVASSGE